MHASSATSPSDLRIVYLTVFLDMFAFAIILPGLPFFAMEMGATGLWLGILLTTYSGAKLLGAAAVGRLSDVYGRRPLLILCLAGSGVSFLLTGVAGTLVALTAARAVAGLFGGTVAAAQAAVADVTAPSQRARYMGLLGAAIGTAFVFGPALGAGLSRLGFPTVAAIGAGIAFLNAALAWARLPESSRRRARPALSAAIGAEALTDALAQISALRILVATFLTLFAFVSMETTLAFFARDRFGTDERGFGMLLAFVGLIMIVVQGWLVGRLVPRYGEPRLAAAGGLLLGVSLVLLPVGPSMLGILPLLGVVALGQGLASPSLSSLLSRASGRSEQGGMLGLGQSVASAGRAVAPVTAGWLYDQGVPLPFIAAGLLAIGAAVAIAGLRLRGGSQDAGTG
jgi:DHA1 family tetracycline resistance protein-like MFS transporter